MGKKNLFVLALCLGAWVNPVMATTTSNISGLEAGFQKLFWNTSIRGFERKLVDQILHEHQEAINRLINEDAEGRELTQRIYTAATADLLEADYRLNSRRQQNSRQLSESLSLTLAQIAQYHFREDVHAVSSSRVGYSEGSFFANAKLSLWTTYYGWTGVTRENEMEIEVRATAAQVQVCMETKLTERYCQPYNYDDEELISDLQSPDGRHIAMPDDMAGGRPLANEPEAKSHFGESGSGF